MGIEVSVRERVLKPAREVFAAFIAPEQMAHYFISSASAPMRAGTQVEWSFADVGAKVPVDVIEVEKDRQIVFDWNACGPKTRVKVQLSVDEPDTTVVTISEAQFAMDDEGVKRALGQRFSRPRRQYSQVPSVE